jgi:hypothetical protein
MDLNKKEQTKRAAIAPTDEGSSASRPMSGRGNARMSKKAMPRVVKVTAICISLLAVVSLSSATR